MTTQIERFTVQIELPFHMQQAITLRCSRLFHTQLKDDLHRIVTETVHAHAHVGACTLRLNLGTMQAWQFEREFRSRFVQELRRALMNGATHAEPDSAPAWAHEKKEVPQTDNSKSHESVAAPLSLDETRELERCFSSSVRESEQELAWRWLARWCLRRASRQYLLHLKTARPSLRRLCGDAQLAESTLLFKALHWLQRQPVSRQPDANLFPRNDADAFVEHVVDANIDKEALAIFSEPAGAALRRWQGLLWRDARVRRLLKHRLPDEVTRRLRQYSRHEPTGIVDEGPEQPATPVSNAGIVSLWPVLPDLFRQLKLWDGKQFTSPDAQEQAAVWLDWVVWQDAPAWVGRSDFTQRVCGLKPQEAPLRFEPAGDEQRSLLVEWLERLPLQLPGWRTLKPIDVRTLFLQRPGSLSIAETGAVLEVAAEPFDVLLQDWPWPLSVLVMPWLRDPLVIDWPIPRFDEWVPNHG